MAERTSQPSQVPRGQARTQRLRRQLIEPLFAALTDEPLPPVRSGARPLPQVIVRNRRERAQSRLADALASRGTDFVPDDVALEVELLVRAWARRAFADDFDEVAAFELRCAEELDLEGQVEAVVDDPTPVDPVAAPERAYLQSILERHAVITLRGPLGAAVIEARLDQSYVPLALDLEGRPWPAPLHATDTAPRPQTALPLPGELPGGRVVIAPTVLRQVGPLLLTAEAGAGKSTLLLALLAGAAADGLRKGGDDGPVPFLVPVRFLDAPVLDEASVAAAAGCDPEFVVRMLRARRALLLIDGLDECSDEWLVRLLGSISEWAARYAGNDLLLAAQPGRVPETAMRERALLGFATAKLAPLTRDDAAALVDRWYAVVESDEATATARAAHLWAELLQRPFAGRICGSPFLLTLLCAMHRQKDGRLPEGASALVGALLEYLLRSAAIDPGTLVAELGPRGLSSVLVDLASFMHRARSVELPVEWVVQRVATMLHHLGRAPSEAARLLLELRDGAGLLHERVPRALSFCHLLFQQHLTALGWVQAAKYDLRSATVRDPWWQEVIVQTCAISQDDAPRVIGALLEGDPRDLGPGMRLASRILDVAPSLPPALREEIDLRLARGLPPIE